jgi:hypothetical protein
LIFRKLCFLKIFGGTRGISFNLKTLALIFFIKIAKNEVLEMVEFETIKVEEIKFGTNNFLEIARKKAISSDGENIFISISRGFFTINGEKRYRKSFTVPMDESVIDFIARKIKEI